MRQSESLGRSAASSPRVSGAGTEDQGGQMSPGNLAGDQTRYFDPQIFFSLRNHFGHDLPLLFKLH